MLAVASILCLWQSAALWYVPFFHPARKGRRPGGRLTALLPVWIGLWQVVLWFVLSPYLGDSAQALALLQTAGFYTLFWLPFYLYPKQVYQNLFLLGVAGLLSTVLGGMGYLVEFMLPFYPLAQARLLNFAVTLVAMLVVFPSFLGALRRLLLAWQGIQATPLWRLFWLIPGSLFLIGFSFGSVFTLAAGDEVSYLISRVVLCVTMYIVLYAVGIVLDQTKQLAILQARAQLSEQQLTLQREQYALLTGRVEQSRRQRSDLRRQLQSVRGHALAGEKQAIADYLRGTLAALPRDSDVLLCRNYAVNAIVRHYLGLAAGEGVRPDVQLDIPERVGGIRDVDLCVVLGNSLENALEASRRIPVERRFIRVRARRQNGYLTITVDNAFDGIYSEKDGAFLSRKRSGEGVGIASVRAVAARYDGACHFTAKQGNFMASIVLRYEDAPGGEVAQG